ncbi:MAG: hypothetical protein KDK24_03705 [Pseudooceanicola sp.]|nr:hypothetical protein [Pseudooceanicola sp.]
MTALHRLIDRAESQLDPANRDRLAELVESFIATHQGSPDFTPDELAHLKRLDAEPFAPADPAEVAALFARRC